MNVLLIHPVPPETPHISAVRLWRFGGELARLGHHVVLLTRTVEPPDGANVVSVPSEHGWSQPLVVRAKDSAPRSSRTGLRRKFQTAKQMIASGGAMAGWVHSGLREALALESSGFRPDVLLATFGSMESLVLARRLSRQMNVPWVADLKDNWRLYAPFGLRHLMARRTKGWSAVTVNGGVTAACARRFQRTEPTLVYSGVDDCYLEPQSAPPGHAPGQFTINLVGGLYFEEPLRELMTGIERWASSRISTDPAVHINYFGSDSERFDAMASRHLQKVSHFSHGYLDKAQLAAHCQWGACNAYVSHWGTFHHKLLELLACGRPILVCPSERAESRDLAEGVSGNFLEGEAADRVAERLGTITDNWNQEASPSINEACRSFSWSAQTAILQKVLCEVIGRASNENLCEKPHK